MIVITGASAGVGRATAQEFARQEAAVALLARQYFPKGTDFRDISHQEVRRVENLLNHRPRACLLKLRYFIMNHAPVLYSAGIPTA